MNTKKIKTYAIVVLVAIIIVKIIVAVSWKLIFLSLIVLAVWFVFEQNRAAKKIKQKLFLK